MPVTQKDILRIAEPVEKMYMDVTAQLIINLCGHFKSGKALATQQWEIQKLSELDALTQESIEIIASTTGQSPEVIRQAVASALKLELSDVEKVLSAAAKAGNIIAPSMSWEASEGIKSVLTNLVQQAAEASNIVNTVMLQSTRERYVNAIFFCVGEEQKLIEQLYSAQNMAELESQLGKVQRNLNQSALSVASGAEARGTALRRTIKKLADEGIIGFVDRGGHHWTPEAYINMDIRTTVHNAAVQGQRARSADYGVSTFQISSHPGARPLCAPYQGKFYSWDNTSGTVHDLYGRSYHYDGINTTSYGQPAGIFGINCGHSPQTFVDGYNIPRYEPTSDPEANAREYQEMQQQRYMERQIRNEKTQALAYQAAGDDEAFKATAIRIKEKQREYEAYCKEHDLPKRVDRTQVVGYNKSVSAKANAVTRINRVEFNNGLDSNRYFAR